MKEILKWVLPNCRNQNGFETTWIVEILTEKSWILVPNTGKSAILVKIVENCIRDDSQLREIKVAE